jgi:hypothetical protein
VGLGKVPEPIRGEKWIQTLYLVPNMLGLGLGLGVVARAHWDDGCTPSKARHVMPSMLGIRPNGGLKIPCPSSGIRLTYTP